LRVVNIQNTKLKYRQRFATKNLSLKQFYLMLFFFNTGSAHLYSTPYGFPFFLWVLGEIFEVL
jgi:hypothetical protein